MRIALDFDDTFTRDPELWGTFVSLAKARGHRVKIVTFRNAGRDNQDIIDACLDLKIEALYTGGVRKREYCYSQGFMPDVWIDDMPEIIGAEVQSDRMVTVFRNEN